MRYKTDECLACGATHTYYGKSPRFCTACGAFHGIRVTQKEFDSGVAWSTLKRRWYKNQTCVDWAEKLAGDRP